MEQICLGYRSHMPNWCDCCCCCCCWSYFFLFLVLCVLYVHIKFTFISFSDSDYTHGYGWCMMCTWSIQWVWLDWCGLPFITVITVRGHCITCVIQQNKYFTITMTITNNWKKQQTGQLIWKKKQKIHEKHQTKNILYTK